jgi:phage I-like protein
MKAYLILKAIEGAPGEFQVLPFGKVEIEGEEDAFVDEESMDYTIAEFERRGNDMVIDYEHQTLTGKEAPAAGWIRKFVKKGQEGLWVVVEWTEKAREYLTKKEYRYFSPVFWVRKADRKIVSIENVALTNFPKINNLHPITAKMNSDFNNLNKSAHGERKQKEEMMLEKLKKLFKLAEDADEAKVVEAVEAVVAKNKDLEKAAGSKADVIACKEVLEVLKLKDDSKKEDVLSAIEALKAPATAAQELSQQVATLSTEIAGMKQEDLVAVALKEGKTSPEELDKWARDLALKSPEQFKLIVLSRPEGSVIPVSDIPPGPGPQEGVLSDDVLNVAKMMNVGQEDLKKYGGLQ